MSEIMQPTMSLRWSASGRLQQKWVSETAPEKWIDIPTEEPKGGFQLTAEPVLNGAKRKPGDLFVDLLPNEWISSLKFADAWKGFVEMRTTIKTPLTERAVRLLVPKLRDIGKRFGSAGALKAMDDATLNHWKTFYDPRDIKPSAPASAENAQEKFAKFIAAHPNEALRQFKSLDRLQPHEGYVRTEFHRWLKTGNYEEKREPNL